MPAPAATVSFALQVGAAETFFQESGMQPVFADPVAPLPIMPAAWLPSLTTAYRQRARTLRQFQNAIGGLGAWRQGHRPHRQDPGTDLCGDCRFGHQHTNRGWWTLGRAALGNGAAVPCTRCHVAIADFITSGNPASRKAENGISCTPRQCRGCQANLTGSLCGRPTKRWQPIRCAHGCGNGTHPHQQ
jgi:hypothetical protein